MILTEGAANWAIHTGNALEVLRRLPAASVDCVVTSPPYWSLREYDVPSVLWDDDPKCKHKWSHYVRPSANGSFTEMKPGNMNLDSATRRPQSSEFCVRCGAWHGQLGIEPTPRLYIQHLRQIFSEVKRVMKPDTALWVNIGDTWYSGAGNGRTMGGSRFDYYRRIQKAKVSGGYPRLPPSRLPIVGLKGKDLVGIPWMLAFALRDECNFWLRSEVIWHKQNGIAKVAEDRPAGIHETIFLLSNAKHYYYEEPWEPASESERRRREREQKRGTGGKKYELKRDDFANPPGATSMMRDLDRRIELAISGRRRLRSVWSIACTPYAGNHSSTFPFRIAEICVKAACPVGGVVLDPFCGAGTTGVMALRMGRKFVGIEACRDTAMEARDRIINDAPLMNGRPAENGPKRAKTPKIAYFSQK